MDKREPATISRIVWPCSKCEEWESDLLALVRYHKAHVEEFPSPKIHPDSPLGKLHAALSDRVKKLLDEGKND